MCERGAALGKKKVKVPPPQFRSGKEEREARSELCLALPLPLPLVGIRCLVVSPPARAGLRQTIWPATPMPTPCMPCCLSPCHCHWHNWHRLFYFFSRAFTGSRVRRAALVVQGVPASVLVVVVVVPWPLAGRPLPSASAALLSILDPSILVFSPRSRGGGSSRCCRLFPDIHYCSDGKEEFR